MSDTTVLVIGDIHVGNISGLMSPRVKLYEKRGKGKAITIEQNREQKILYRGYLDIIHQCAPIDAVIMMGDMVDGLNEKAKGVGLWTSDYDEQILEAHRLMKMTGAKQYFGVMGTPYHTSQNLNCDQVLYEKLNAQYAMNADIDIEGVHFYTCHKIGSSSSIYQQTALSVQMVKGETAKDKIGNFPVKLYGHTHGFHYQGTSKHLGIKTPCFKTRDEYAEAHGLSFFPTLGALCFRCCDGEFTWKPYTFDLPVEMAIPRFKYGVPV